ncbi:MAG TPA: tandem-95 repeat protein, partial [Chloroflexi bacterium]|nr:tandem-95 repeat protein [Chloroflexota bacterium]
DSDLDGDSLTVTAVTQPANGSVTLVGGMVRYTPNANYNGADSFTYTVSDGALTATATVAITVRPVNDAPTAVNDAFNVDEDSLDNVLAVLANDSDLDGDNLTVTAVTQPANGSVTLVGGVVRYAPNANYNGADNFTYTVSDGALTATAAVAITVRPINDAPTAGDDAFQVDRNSADNMLDVLANDSDLDNDSLTLVAVSSPDQGSAVISGAAIRYTPPVGYVGAARFTYTVSDGVLTATATVEVTVRAFNRAPTATDDRFTVTEDSGASDLAVLTNDSDPDSDPLVIAAVTTPANGTTTIAGDRVRYTPNADFHGADTFTYTVSDGGLSATARVTVTVTPVNDAPTAVNDSFSVDEDSLDNALAVLANDSDLDGDSLTVTAVTQPANGVVTLVGGVVRYTPNPNFNGADSFTYTVSDNALTATATVAITVRPVNDAPTAVNDSFSVDEDSLDNALAVLANDSDLDGDNLTVTAVTQPTNGSVMLVAGVVRYTPNANYNGADSFTYTVSDGALTATATVVITVAGVNRAPLAVNDVFTVTENSANNVLAVRANDSDPDNDALTIVAVGVASNGVASHDGAVVRYTPNPNYRGADSFTYTISDGELTATATVAIHVQPAAGAPGVMLALAIEGSGAAGDGVITVGQTVTVVATITNTGQSALMVVPLRLAVAPAVLEMVGASLTPDNVSGGMHVWDDVTGAGTLAPGARTEVRVIFRSIGPSHDLPGQVMTAAGIVQGATDAAGQTAPPANAVAQVRVTAPQVAIATRMIDPAGGELKANQVLTMSVRITNTGDTLITTLPLRDRFDGAVLTFVRASVSGGKVTGSGAAAQVAWSDLTTALGDLAPGQSVEVLITYRIKVVFWSSVRQSVVEGARDEYGDLLPAATASTTIYCMKLELTMTAQPPAGSRVPRNAEIEYTLRLRTPGVAPLTNLVLRSNVTGDGAFYIEDAMDGAASALDHATTCPVRVGAPSHATQQTWVMDRLDAGASCTIVFKTKVAATRKSGFVEVSVEGMAAELLTPATVKVRHSVTTQLSADIAAFAATRRAAAIDVFWAALVEEDVTGYHVWRSVHNELSTAERITAQPVAPASGAQGFYTIVDALPDGAEEAYYWLEVIRNDASEFVGPVWIAPQTQTLLYLPITMKASQR